MLLGDILYHGPRNDLPRDSAPKEVLALLNEQKNRIFCVRGNCDTEVDQMVLDFPIMADYALLSVNGKTLFLTHGHLFNADIPPIYKVNATFNADMPPTNWKNCQKLNKKQTPKN